MRGLPWPWILLAVVVLGVGAYVVLDRPPALDRAPVEPPPLPHAGGPTDLPHEPGADAATDGDPARLEGRGEPVRLEAARVRVLSVSGQPLPGVRIHLWSDPAGEKEWLFTDAQGEAPLGEVPLDGSISVALVGGEPHPVQQPLVVLRSDLGVPCSVTCVDAETGRTVSGVPWSAARAGWGSAPMGEGAREVPLARGSWARMTWAVEAPVGYVAWPPFDWTDALSRYATRAVVLRPLYREAEVEVEILDADGRALPDASVTHCAVTGGKVDATFEAVAPHVYRVRGVPFIEGVLLHLTAGAEVEKEYLEVLTKTPLQRRSRVTIRFPRLEDYEEVETDLGFNDNSTIGLGGRAGTEEPPPPGTVTIEAKRYDGRPAAGAGYEIVACRDRPAVSALLRGRFDATGRVTLEVPAGRCRIELEEGGLVPVAAELSVVEGEAHAVTLQEPRGADLDVRIVDEKGDPVPFAQLEVVAWPWVDLDADGVQRLDPFVDRDGRRTLRRLPVDREIVLVVRWLDRKARSRLRLRDKEQREVVLRVQ